MSLSKWMRTVGTPLAIALTMKMMGGFAFAQDAAPAPASAPAVPVAPGAQPLPETVIEGQQPAPEPAPTPDEIPDVPQEETTYFSSPFSVPEVQGYNAETAVTATMTNTPILSTPASINIITRDVIFDQQALSIDDLIRDIPSAIKTNNQTYNDAFSIRGFEVHARDFRKNGFLDPTPAPRDVANMQRVEILKGPASVLYGSGQPSGVVDVVTKKPLDTLYHSGNLQVGNYDLYRATIDSTGRLFDNSNILYRINMAAEDTNGFRDFYFMRKFFIAPVMTWVISDETSLTLEGEYLNDRRRFDTGSAAINGNVFALPIDRYLGQAGDFQHFEDRKIEAYLNHQFNDDWAMRWSANAFWYSNPSQTTSPITSASQIANSQLGPLFFPPSANTLLGATNQVAQFKEQYYSTILNLTGNVQTGAIEHNLLFGTELGWFVSDNFVANTSDLLTNTGAFAPFPGPFVPTFPIDPFNPTPTLRRLRSPAAIRRSTISIGSVSTLRISSTSASA